jgi:hypothetical protein
MTEGSPEAIQFGQVGWWYVEFRGPGTPGHPIPVTPGIPNGTSSPGGVTGALTWLNEKVAAGSNPVFGNIDSGGTVRLFWYGTELNIAGPPLVLSADLTCACSETASRRGLVTHQPAQDGPEPQTWQ